MTHHERRQLIDRPFPPIEQRSQIVGKSWGGYSIRDREHDHQPGWHSTSEIVNFLTTLSVADEEDYSTFLEGLFAPRRSRSRGER